MIGNKRILSVITARGGSKGIKNKNVKLLMGKPLFMWSVLASLQSKYIDKTVISSDCYLIENIYIDILKNRNKWDSYDFSKLMFIKRPERISGDLSKNEEALIHAYKWTVNLNKLNYSTIINLQPTSPCRFDGLIDKCIEEYYNGEYDSLLTGTKETPFIWQRKDGEWKYTVDKNNCCNRKMRQEFKDDEFNSEFVFHDNGNIYIMDSKILLDTECRIGYNPCIYETKDLENKQIDEEFDFEFIETMLKIKELESPIRSSRNE